MTSPPAQMTPQERLNRAVFYALKEGCFFPVPEPKPSASTQELVQWGAMRALHDAIKQFAEHHPEVSQ